MLNILSSFKSYLVIGATAVLAVFYAIFKKTRKENARLKEVVENQEQEIYVLHNIEEVSTHTREILQVQKDLIDIQTKESIQETNTLSKDSELTDEEIKRIINE